MKLCVEIRIIHNDIQYGSRKHTLVACYSVYFFILSNMKATRIIYKHPRIFQIKISWSRPCSVVRHADELLLAVRNKRQESGRENNKQKFYVWMIYIESEWKQNNAEMKPADSPVVLPILIIANERPSHLIRKGGMNNEQR